MASSASFINVKISDILLGTYSEMLQYKDYIVIATSPVLRTQCSILPLIHREEC